MRSTLWLLLTLVKFGKRFYGNGSKEPSKPAPPGGGGSLLKWFILGQLGRYGYNLLKTLLMKMSVIDVPEVSTDDKRSPDELVAESKFYFVDKDFRRETVYKNFTAPDSAKYKLVSFSNGVGFLEALVIAWFRGLRIANLNELISVEKSCNLKELGLGENYNIIALGTVVRRASTIFAICAPMVSFNMREKDGKQVREVSLRLYDLFDLCSPHCHILFRVK